MYGRRMNLFGARAQWFALSALAWVTVLGGCSHVNEAPTPIFPTVKPLIVNLIADTTSFSLGSNVHQGFAYTVTFDGLRKGKVLPTREGDSLRYVKTEFPLVGADSGSYTVCYGADCRSATIRFLNN